MPRRNPRDPDDDDRPAFGLRDDAFDDRLRAEQTDDDWDDRDGRRPYQLRKIENYSPDPADWILAKTATQTEVALRVACFLIVSGLAAAKVVVTLAGSELTHREQPRFPVDRFLVERLGFRRRRVRKNSWVGSYTKEGFAHALVLLDLDRSDGHVETRLADGRRLIVLPSRGLVASSRSSAEIKWVQNAIGRAAIYDCRARDQLAIAVPRSAQFSKHLHSCRRRPKIQQMGLLLLAVDRLTGDVSGLPRPDDLS
jgi:hypothetical protein